MSSLLNSIHELPNSTVSPRVLSCSRGRAILTASQNPGPFMAETSAANHF